MGDNFHEHTDDDDEDKIQRISNENSFVYEGFVDLLCTTLELNRSKRGQNQPRTPGIQI